MNCQSLFSEKKKKRNILNLLSTELAQRMIKDLRLKIITSLSSFTILVTLQVDDDVMIIMMMMMMWYFKSLST